MGRFLLAIDQGTTGSTVVVLGDDARILGKATREFPQHFPQPSWVEHDTGEIRASVDDALADALAAAGVKGTDCAGIGITNQRETTVLWDRKTGRPVHRAIVWQDRRTADRCTALRAAGLEDLFRERTGLVLDPYFSGTKIEWICDSVDGARAPGVQCCLAVPEARPSPETEMTQAFDAHKHAPSRREARGESWRQTWRVTDRRPHRAVPLPSSFPGGPRRAGVPGRDRTERH